MSTYPLIKNLSEEKIREIEAFLITRHEYLRDLRYELDKEVLEEVKIYNNIDDDIDELKQEHESQVKIPYVYTIIQTMTARILGSLFPSKNYIKSFMEREKLLDIEDDITQWLQEELDKLKLKKRARDFIEEALAKRVSWIQLRPSKNPKFKIDLDIHGFFDIWYDTKAICADDTDFFVRKMKKKWEVKKNKSVYFNTENLTSWVMNQSDDSQRRDEYKYKHSGGSSRPDYHTDDNGHYMTDEVELIEYYGVYDMNPKSITDKTNTDYEPDVQEVIFTLANRTTLIGAQKNTIETKKKRLFFPIRPLRQANSLVGKGGAQLVKDIAKNVNQVASLRMDNYKLLIKLLFRYNRDADIDLDELFAGAGNAVGYTGDKNNSVDTFEIPNMLNESTSMLNEDIKTMQQTTGAVDYVQGLSPSGSQTASEVRSGTEQALFKFSMMSDNCYDDLMEMVNYVVVLCYLYNDNEIILRHPTILPFFAEMKKIEDVEESYIFDIELKEISQRRDIERQQWSNAIGVVAPFLQQVGGNMQELLKQFFIAFQVPNADKILQPESPQAISAKLLSNPELLNQVMTIVASAAQQQEAGPSGRPRAATAVPKGGTIEQQQEGALRGAGSGPG